MLSIKWIDRIVASTLTIGMTIIAIVFGTGALSTITAICGLYAMILYCKSKQPIDGIDIHCHTKLHIIGAIGFVLFTISVHVGSIRTH